MAKKADNHETDGKSKADRKAPAPVFPTMSAAELSYANELAQLGYEATEESVIRYAILTSDPEVDPHTITERDIQKKVYDEMNRRETARAPSQAYRIGHAPAQAAGTPAAVPVAEAAEPTAELADALARIGQLEQQLKGVETDFAEYSEDTSEQYKDLEKQFSDYKKDTEGLLAARDEDIEALEGRKNSLLSEKAALKVTLGDAEYKAWLNEEALYYVQTGAQKPEAPKPPEGPSGKVTIGGPAPKAEAKAVDEETIEDDYLGLGDAEAKAILADLVGKANEFNGTDLEGPAAGYVATAEKNYKDGNIKALKEKRDKFEKWAEDWSKPAPTAAKKENTVPAPVADEAKKKLAEAEAINLVNGLAKETGKLLERYGKDDAEVKELDKYASDATEALERGDLDGAKRIVLKANAYKAKADNDKSEKFLTEKKFFDGKKDILMKQIEEAPSEGAASLYTQEARLAYMSAGACVVRGQFDLADENLDRGFEDIEKARRLEEERRAKKAGKPAAEAKTDEIEWDDPEPVAGPKQTEWVINRAIYERYEDVLGKYFKADQDGSVVLSATDKELEGLVAKMNETKDEDESPYNPNFVPSSAYDSYSAPKKSRFGPKTPLIQSVPKAAEKPVAVPKDVNIKADADEWEEPDEGMEPKTTVMIPKAAKKTPEDYMLEDDEPEEGKGKGRYGGESSILGDTSNPNTPTELPPKIPLTGNEEPKAEKESTDAEIDEILEKLSASVGNQTETKTEPKGKSKIESEQEAPKTDADMQREFMLAQAERDRKELEMAMKAKSQLHKERMEEQAQLDKQDLELLGLGEISKDELEQRREKRENETRSTGTSVIIIRGRTDGEPATRSSYKGPVSVEDAKKHMDAELERDRLELEMAMKAKEQLHKEAMETREQEHKQEIKVIQETKKQEGQPEEKKGTFADGFAEARKRRKGKK